MSAPRRWRATLAAVPLLAGLLVAGAPSRAQQAPSPSTTESPPAEAPATSALDASLFYQLLIGEMELRGGEAGTAYEVILDAARRTRDEALFRRAVDIALGARAGEQALAATRAWRVARPESLDAIRLQLQILVALNRPAEIAEPLRQLLAQTPEAERAGTLASLPRFLQRVGEPAQVVQLVEQAARPYRDAEATRVAARIAVGRAWLAAREPERALAIARETAALDPVAPGPALLALELMRERPEAEALVVAYLGQPKAEPALRLAYVRVLTGAQRYADAVAQLEIATTQQPEVAGPFLTLGALHLELRHPKEGEAALLRYVELVQGRPDPAAKAGAPAGSSPGEDDDDETDLARADRGLVQAWLMLAQAAEQRGDYAAAERWLARIDDPQRALEVQTRRASMLARQGQVAQARELIRRTPERTPEDARAKLVAEAGVLRDAKRWREAFDVLADASSRFPDDGDLLYEQAMMAEKLDRLDEMERLLRRVIELKPDNAHAHNALGYSLADRSQRLPEARQLIQRALELAPGDPFITDSLGWVEFRMGNREEALRLLQGAYQSRPDPEIGAHLGEVLWSLGRQDEARRVWREVRTRDASNEVLRETLARLQVDL
jgi:tetratricopeptide (TPR) repeat protein